MNCFNYGINLYIMHVYMLVCNNFGLEGIKNFGYTSEGIKYLCKCNLYLHIYMLGMFLNKCVFDKYLCAFIPLNWHIKFC